jgi:hypothetical protein
MVTNSAQRVALTAEMTTSEALAHLQSGAIPIDQYLQWDAARLQRVAAASRAPAPRALSCKVSEKGCLSVYGLNRQWPVSLYVEQWEKLAEFMPKVLEFAKANDSKLSRKATA